MSATSDGSDFEYNAEELQNSLDVDGARSLSDNGNMVVQEMSETGLEVYAPNTDRPDRRQRRKTKAMCPGYTSFENRLVSYQKKRWNAPNAPLPIVLARAGFFYTGKK